MTAAKVSMASVIGSRIVEIAASFEAFFFERVICATKLERTSGIVCVKLLGNTRMISSTSSSLLVEIV